LSSDGDAGRRLEDSAGNAFDFRPVSCPICGIEPAISIGYRGGDHQRYGLGVSTHIMRCGNCGLLIPNPFPFPVKPQELYGDPAKYFEGHDTPLKLENYGTIIGEMTEFWTDNRPRPDAKPSLLDVGSGRGEALQAAKLAGLTDIVGLELSQAMSDDAAKQFGADVLVETVEQHAQATTRTYDLVLLSAVLEHVYDPDSMISSVATLTQPGSMLYIDVPREPNLVTVMGNVSERLRHRRTVYNLSPTFPPYHVFGFNPRSMKILLRKHGFEPVRWLIVADPHIPARGGLRDKARALVATQVSRIGNLIRFSSNMAVWARRV